MEARVDPRSARRVVLPHLEAASGPGRGDFSVFIGPYGVWAERPRRPQACAASRDDGAAGGTSDGDTGDGNASGGSGGVGGAAAGDVVKVVVPPELCLDASALTAEVVKPPPPLKWSPGPTRARRFAMSGMDLGKWRDSHTGALLSSPTFFFAFFFFLSLPLFRWSRRFSWRGRAVASC